MTIDEKIRDKKLQYNIKREASKISVFSSSELINMNMLHVKKYYLLIKVKWHKKLDLHIHLLEKCLKKKLKQVNKIKGEKVQALKILSTVEEHEPKSIGDIFSKEWQNN